MLKFSDQATGEVLKQQIKKLDEEVRASYPITPLLSLGLKNNVCVDLGVNIGAFVRHAAAHFKNVYGDRKSVV